MPRIPITQVRTSHALSIRANGIGVGLINSWNPIQSRTATPIFEIGSDGSGNPDEIMPGNANGLTINVSRYDIYTSRMERAFGTSDLIMLTSQNQPIELVEVWKIPNQNLLAQSDRADSGSPFTDEERFIYRNCWFTSLGRTMRSDDNRIVNVNATIAYTIKLKVTGILGAALQL